MGGKARAATATSDADGGNKSTKLIVSFVAMVFVGLGNKIFQKLETIPMHNYPLFLNMMTTFIYIPISFAYILPMITYGNAITPQQRSVPKRTFAVMGGLDAMAGILQVFAATYLGGSLIILLGQAAIPVSMAISSALLKTRYSIYQYIGALVVTVGLVVVLGPGSGSDSGGGSGGGGSATIAWSMVMILSCVPMCLSSVYKEKALGETELDAVYLNGWVAVFQFIASIPLTVPAAKIGDPPVSPDHILQNLYDGFQCYLGHNTILDGPHKDKCEMATVYVSAYIVFNVVYNLLIIFILKFGSANILWLAMTIMVPLGNVAFTFPFMPEHQPLHTKDILGLFLIMGGLFVYRFLEDLSASWREKRKQTSAQDPATSELKKSLILFEDGESYNQEVRV